MLDVLHAAGLRSLGIVWSRPNAFGYGVPFRFITYTLYAFPMMVVSVAICHVYVWWRYF